MFPNGRLPLSILQHLTLLGLFFVMFPVASHPSHADGQSQAAVQLPRNLAHPPYVNISCDAIVAVAPELESVPTEYILTNLRPEANMYVALIECPTAIDKSGNSMLVGNAVLSSSIPSSLSRSQLHSSMTVPGRVSSECELPTHILALSSSTSSSGSNQVRLFPIHSLVLASHCARLPPFPPFPPSQASAGSSQVTYASCPPTVSSLSRSIRSASPIHVSSLTRLSFDRLVPTSSEFP
jgi:hypothetical protein